MTERVELPVTAARMGDAELGPARALVDDEMLIIVRSDARDARDERPAGVPLGAIERLESDDRAVRLVVAGGAPVMLASPAAARLAEALLAHCRALPELTRTLRAFGSSRGARGRRDGAAAEQRRFFAPLLEARREGAAAPISDGALRAFDADALSAAFARVLDAFAAERFPVDGPYRRALRADLAEASEPLERELVALRAAADVARSCPDDLRCWRAWSVQLRAVFECADRVWSALDASLDAAPPAVTP